MQPVNHSMSDKCAEQGVEYVYINPTNHFVINCAYQASFYECVQAGCMAWLPVLLTFHSDQALIYAMGSFLHAWELGFGKCLCKQCSIITVFRQAELLIFHLVRGKMGITTCPGCQTFFFSFFFYPLFKVLPQEIQDNFRAVMGNVSGVIESLGFCSIDFYGTGWL